MLVIFRNKRSVVHACQPLVSQLQMPMIGTSQGQLHVHVFLLTCTSLSECET